MSRPSPDRLIDAHIPETTWRNHAACKGIPIEGNPFYEDDDPEAMAKAKAICFGCSVRPQCLEDALFRQDEEGVWGGLTPSERRTIAKHRRKVTP